MPKAFMGSDEALNAAASVAIGVCRPPGQHNFKRVQQVLSDFKVGRVASMVKCH